MAQSRKTDDPTGFATSFVGTRIREAYTAMGIPEPDKQVWSSAVPTGTELPYAIMNVRSMPSVLAGTKDTEPVEVRVTVRLHDTDESRARKMGAEVQERVTDRENPPSDPEWDVIWHDLVFHAPHNDIKETAPNIYGRVLEFEFHIERA